MTMRVGRWCLSTLLLISVLGSAPAATSGLMIYVSPKGSDVSGNGSYAAPYQTLTHARDVIRTLPNRNVNVNVYLRAGTYTLTSPIVFNGSDSGVGGHYVYYRAYPGSRPVISGGVAVRGWTLHDAGRNIWQANVGTGLVTRQLYVNGRRAQRAASATGLPDTVIQTATGYTTTDLTMLPWRNPSNVEFVYTGSGGGTTNWTEVRVGVQSITQTATGLNIVMKQPGWTNAVSGRCCGQTVKLPSSVENAYELLVNRGQWYLDHAAGILYYIPLAGEDMSKATVVAPVLESLIEGDGTAAAPIQNVEFYGLTFAYATWLDPSTGDGFVENQANQILVGSPVSWSMIPSNVVFHRAKGVIFDQCLFEHLGASGLAIDGGSQNNTVIGCGFYDISGTGLRIGNVDNPDAVGADQDTGNIVRSNYIDGVADEYHGGVGLMAGYVSKTTITHNEICNLPYTGISLGWGWGRNSYAANNVVSNNRVHDYMKLLMDGGGIYTLSAQGPSASAPFTSIHDNYFYNQGHEYGALYPDEGSAYENIYNNVCASVPRWLHIWTPSIHDINVHDNYADTSVNTENGTRITLTNNYTAGSPWPTPATSIMGQANIEALYAGIKSLVPAP